MTAAPAMSAVLDEEELAAVRSALRLGEMPTAALVGQRSLTASVAGHALVTAALWEHSARAWDHVSGSTHSWSSTSANLDDWFACQVADSAARVWFPKPGVWTAHYRVRRHVYAQVSSLWGGA